MSEPWAFVSWSGGISGIWMFGFFFAIARSPNETRIASTSRWERHKVLKSARSAQEEKRVNLICRPQLVYCCCCSACWLMPSATQSHLIKLEMFWFNGIYRFQPMFYLLIDFPATCGHQLNYVHTSPNGAPFGASCKNYYEWLWLCIANINDMNYGFGERRTWEIN